MKKLSVIQREIKYLIVLNIKPFINKYNWGKINYPPKIGEWKNFEKNNPTDALNILYTKKKNYFQLTFQNMTQPAKNK